MDVNSAALESLRVGFKTSFKDGLGMASTRPPASAPGGGA